MAKKAVQKRNKGKKFKYRHPSQSAAPEPENPFEQHAAAKRLKKD